MTTVSMLLRDTTERLARAGIGDARLEADLLWMTALDTDRTHLYAKLQDTPDQNAMNAAADLLERRLRHEPVAYLMGRREFFALQFYVAPGVLIPRPETELVVEEALRLLHKRLTGSVADIGTGSGAIAVSVAVNCVQATVYASDISARALEIAALNAREHGVSDRVRFITGDLLSPIPGPVDLILANLPYVMSSEVPTLEPELRLYEPLEAFDGGADGLVLIGKLLADAPRYLNKGGAVVLEMDPRQIDLAKSLALEAFPGTTVRILLDLAGRPRVLVVEHH
ncbi:MAG: peptide chain release factor N(5)-glutamine methyltransferase [Chloroflexi bacterium]|nr:peptide chain release factor N(5)-glutamine methyltransferase [Chloroflexota bacterium]